MNSNCYPHQSEPGDTIAIVGMACCFPKAPDLAAFWRNIIHKTDAVTDAPPDRWDPDRFYDRQFEDKTKVYAKRGGYLASPFRFDPAEFGIMPKAVEGGEPDQFLVLKTAAEAMRDAGIEYGDPANERAAFILGRGSYLSAGAFNLLQRTFVVEQTARLVARMHPDMPADGISELKESLTASLKPFEAETAPSVMPNITAGRVANRLGLMGPNYTIDAACASSLYAVDAAAAGLLSGRSDLALAGGVHIFNNVPFLNVFCTLGAMSHQDQIRPFDEKADGMLPGEGVGIVVLKRTSDAEKDGDRIYAVIRSVGTSSDGRGISVAAPRMEGEVLALERAYRAAGVLPDTIELIEAHGTATPVGDTAEIQSLTRVFGKKDESTGRHCALGAVKSMIGHAMPAAGIASLIKTVLSLHYKVLPPTLHCQTPHPKFELETTPFYINTETRPWFRTSGDFPRRAGVNAFGFGGVNAHVVLEEYDTPRAISAEQKTPNTAAGHSCGLDWDAALFLFSDASRAGLVAQCHKTRQLIEDSQSFDLMAVSHSLLKEYTPGEHRLAIIAGSPEDLTKKLEYAAARLQKPGLKKIKDVKGIYYFGEPLGKTGKVAFMYPGEGAAYTNMMMDLCLQFSSVRAAFDEMNIAIAGRKQKSRYLPTRFVFPATLLTETENKALEAEFWKADSGLQAILASSLGMTDLLSCFDIAPDMMVGHSAGEYSAWIASGILDKNDLYRHQEQIAAIYADSAHRSQTAMIAISAGINKVKPVLETISGDIYISNDNCPHQVVVVGEKAAMDRFKAALTESRLLSTDLPSREVHHTPMAAPQAGPLRRAFSSLCVSAATIPVYSPVISAPYPDNPKEILDLMVDYWLTPLRFRQTVETMYEDGARIFIEVGPGNNLCGFVDDTLRGKSFMTVVSNSSRRSGTSQLCHLLGMLAAQHVPVSLAPLLAAQQPLIAEQTEKKEKKPGQRKAMTVKMDLGLPELHLSDSVLANWRKRLAPAETAAPPVGPADSPPAEIPKTDFRPDAASLPHAGQIQNPTHTSRGRVMKQYMNTMSRFLDLQKEITLAVNAQNRPAATGGRPLNDAILPMTGRVTVAEPQKRIQTERLIDLSRDIFLFDHPFGGDVSEADDRLSPLIVTPLTLNMEIMTEAAALLFSGKKPVAIKNMKAGRWIVVDEETGVRLTAEASAAGTDEAAVRLYDLSAGQTPSAEATVIFGNGYAPADPSASIPDAAISPEAKKQAGAMYAEKYMTHGPRFQVITGITQTEQNEIIAALAAPAHHDLFAAGNRTEFLINPLLMDACAQLTGYWAQLSLTERFITFPAGAGDIRFFSTPPRPGDLPWCRMRIRDITDQFIRSDLTIFNDDGTPWARINGWTHRRFDLPLELYQFWRFPRKNIVSNVSSATPAENQHLTCAAPYYEVLNGTVWKKAIAYFYLNRAERRSFHENVRQKNSAGHWLSERIAAKDAVRIFVQQNRRKLLAPADITLLKSKNGYLIPKSKLVAGLENQLALSVSRSEASASARVIKTAK